MDPIKTDALNMLNKEQKNMQSLGTPSMEVMISLDSEHVGVYGTMFTSFHVHISLSTLQILTGLHSNPISDTYYLNFRDVETEETSK